MGAAMDGATMAVAATTAATVAPWMTSGGRAGNFDEHELSNA